MIKVKGDIQIAIIIRNQIERKRERNQHTMGPNAAPGPEPVIVEHPPSLAIHICKY